MKYWIVADTHFGHQHLVEKGYRPADFEKRILDNLETARMHQDDVLIHLGDFALSNDADWSKDFLHCVPCFHSWLILGDHDGRSPQWYLDRAWSFVGYQIRIKRFGLEIAFSHIPIPEDTFDLNIHGHFHDTDHRRHEPEISAVLTEKHVLVKQEPDYKPVMLKHLVQQATGRKT